MSKETPKFALPPALVSKIDLARLIREVEMVDSTLEAQKVRGYTKEQMRLPTLSRSLADFLELNKLDILDNQKRMILKEDLRVLKDRIPVMHMTFASEVDPESLEYLVAWVRKELHPQALISVGLQPSLIGGVYIRTPNHVHDLSMRALFKGKTELLVKDLEGLHSGE